MCDTFETASTDMCDYIRTDGVYMYLCIFNPKTNKNISYSPLTGRTARLVSDKSRSKMIKWDVILNGKNGDDDDVDERVVGQEAFKGKGKAGKAGKVEDIVDIDVGDEDASWWDDRGSSDAAVLILHSLRSCSFIPSASRENRIGDRKRAKRNSYSRVNWRIFVENCRVSTTLVTVVVRKRT